MYKHSVRKPSGYITLTDPDSGKLLAEYDTLQCVHCQGTWQVLPGSGRIRGWCMKCKGHVCGSELCVKECVPKEAQLEIYEGNKKTIMKYANTQTAKLILAEIAAVEKYLIKIGVK